MQPNITKYVFNTANDTYSLTLIDGRPDIMKLSLNGDSDFEIVMPERYPKINDYVFKGNYREQLDTDHAPDECIQRNDEFSL